MNDQLTRKEFVEKTLGAQGTKKKNKAQKEKSSPIHGNMVKKYLKLCAENNVEPDFLGMIDVATGYKSIAGGVLEKVFSAAANYEMTKNETGIHYCGSTIMDHIKTLRNDLNKDASTLDIDDVIEEMHQTYYLDTQWLRSMLTFSPVWVETKQGNKFLPLSVPDSVTIKKNGEKVEIRIAEAKLSGELDCKNGPANVKTLMESACYVPSETISVERRIFLTGTLERTNGTFPMASRWENVIKKLDVKLGVSCNQHAFEWASGEKTTKEAYDEDVLSVVEDILAARLYDELHN